jgi:hypothetical protein
MPEYIRPQMIWQLPPEYAAWARENGVPQLEDHRGLRDFEGLTGGPAEASPLRLTSPDRNRVYTRDPGLPANAQQVPITALPDGDLAAAGGPITLLADGMPVAVVGAPDYTAWWPLTAGQHTFVAVATRPDGTRVESEPVTVRVE